MVTLYVGPLGVSDTDTYIAEEDEDDARARIVWNTDDDNGNGIADYQELTPVAGEDDLLELKLDQYLRSDELTRDWQFDFSFGTDYIRIWESKEKSREIIAGSDLLLDDLPDSVWLEGVSESVPEWTYSTLFSVEQKLFEHPNHHPPVMPFDANDYNRFATRANLTAYRPMSNGPNTGYELFGKTSVREDDEDENDLGPGIRINGDDDYDSDIPDWRESSDSADEDDLIEVTVTRLAGQQVGLRVASGAMIVWASARKGGLPLVTSETPLTTLNFHGSDPFTVFVEWADDVHGTGNLELVDMATGQVEDALLFHTFHSLAIGLSGELFGESSGGGDLSSSGVLPIMRDMYESGYDAYLFNEDDVAGGGASRGYGEVRQEIRRAVGGDPYGVFPGRFVTEIGLIGHSHGGGSVYDLTWRLNQDVLDGKFTTPFSIAFTAYIDAIEQEHLWKPPWKAISAETRLPVGTKYHANYYQRITGAGGLYLNGDVVNGAVVNINVNVVNWNDRFGNDLTHSTIDDSEDLKDHVLPRFKNRVAR